MLAHSEASNRVIKLCITNYEALFENPKSLIDTKSISEKVVSTHLGEKKRPLAALKLLAERELGINEGSLAAVLAATKPKRRELRGEEQELQELEEEKQTLIDKQNEFEKEHQLKEKQIAEESHSIEMSLRELDMATFSMTEASFMLQEDNDRMMCDLGSFDGTPSASLMAKLTQRELQPLEAPNYDDELMDLLNDQIELDEFEDPPLTLDLEKEKSSSDTKQESDLSVCAIVEDPPVESTNSDDDLMNLLNDSLDDPSPDNPLSTPKNPQIDSKVDDLDLELDSDNELELSSDEPELEPKKTPIQELNEQKSTSDPYDDLLELLSDGTEPPTLEEKPSNQTPTVEPATKLSSQSFDKKEKDILKTEIQPPAEKPKPKEQKIEIIEETVEHELD